jgi:hypothetical protein
MEKTQKWHVLAVLESGKLMSINQIRIMLEKDFSLKPKPAALWKMLQRCSCSSYGQGLISIEKIGRNNFCRITEKGKKRRKIVAARKEKEFKDQLSRFYSHEAEKSNLASQQKQTRSLIVKRKLEVDSSLRLCDVLLSRTSDPNARDFALTLRLYWLNESRKLAPYAAEELAKILDETSKKLADALEKWSSIFQTEHQSSKVSLSKILPTIILLRHLNAVSHKKSCKHDLRLTKFQGPTIPRTS